jgi:hypothetical protein
MIGPTEEDRSLVAAAYAVAGLMAALLFAVYGIGSFLHG